MQILPYTKSSTGDSKRLESFYRLQSIGSSFWSFSSFCESLGRQDVQLFQALLADNLIGFYMTLHQVDGIELLYIYVAPTQRGKGVASKLLSHLKANFLVSASSIISIEVRPSNIQAIKAYLNAGFKTVRTRAKYYKDGEDALILTIQKR